MQNFNFFFVWSLFKSASPLFLSSASLFQLNHDLSSHWFVLFLFLSLHLSFSRSTHFRSSAVRSFQKLTRVACSFLLSHSSLPNFPVISLLKSHENQSWCTYSPWSPINGVVTIYTTWPSVGGSHALLLYSRRSKYLITSSTNFQKSCILIFPFR